MNPLLLLSLLALLAACDAPRVLPADAAAPDGDLSLTTDREVYAPGDAARLTLRNDGSDTGEMGVLSCATLERRAEAGWDDDLPFNDRACILVVVYVAPGEEVTAELPLDGVEPGTYRFAHEVSGSTVATAPFEVR